MAGLLEWEMKQGGADEPAFKTICAVGERASLPHAPCTDRSAGPDSPILLDWGARVGGYNSDLTRMTGTGTMPDPILELAQVVLEAQETAFERLGPGVRCRDVDEAARSVVVRAGYGPNFGHGLGHGVGLEVHEAPRLAAKVEEVLLPGMVVTIEPGIYLPGVGGVRIEDMAVITPGGHEVLSSLERRPGGR
jgi:Xaa-Pro aminopeptidase